LHRINIKKLYIVLVILGMMFLISGGFYALQSYMNGGLATTYQEYLMGMLYPLFLGSIVVGSFGLMFAYKNRSSPVCLVGFLIVLICYFFAEYLFNVIGGNDMFGGL
jgi:uncharacterized membrane protein YdcZ (DUF606 family)